MCQLLETIKLENGILQNMKYHNIRYKQARKELFGIEDSISLEDLIDIPSENKTGIFRCRILYSKEIEKVEFIPHQPRQIKSLKVIEDNKINYQYKFSDRDKLSELYQQRGECDEIIIVKNNHITDCFIGNIVFFDGNEWVTPSTPLLEGTQRMRLLEEGKIHEKEIMIDNLSDYSKVGIINVFYDLDNMSKIDIKKIKF